jgi:hypothetical protein
MFHVGKYTLKVLKCWLQTQHQSMFVDEYYEEAEEEAEAEPQRGGRRRGRTRS